MEKKVPAIPLPRIHGIFHEAAYSGGFARKKFSLCRKESLLHRLYKHFLATLLLCIAPFAGAQVDRVSGQISGTVQDAAGAPVAGAQITLTGEDGSTHSTQSGAAGGFLLLNLPTDVYTVRATASGFTADVEPNIAVAVGRSVALTLVLHPAGAKTAVTVHARPGLLDAQQTASTESIDKDRIEELPIPSRNYLSFALLAPQVAAGNPALAQQTHADSNGGFSFGGLRPSSNALYIDGVEDNDETTGASRTELSPEAISDFQVVNHGFAANSGGAAGGALDVQTRAGVKMQHGDAFIFEQNAALNAIQPLENDPYKPDENRFRAGLSTGGALGRGGLFYYVAAEQEYARGEDANDIAPATLGAVNQALATSGPLRGLQLQGGFIPTTEQETEFSARADRNMTARETLMLRYALTNNRNVNDAFNTDDLSDKSARGSAFMDDNSLNGMLTSSFSAAALNRLSFEVSQRRAVQRTVATQMPGVLIPGVLQLGTPYFGNSRRYETHLDLEENFLRQHGRHLMQAGGGVEYVALRAQTLDGFAGLYVFPNLAAFSSGAAAFYTQSFGDPDTNFSEVRSSAYVQDHWTPWAKVTLDAGLRYEDNALPAPLPQAPWNFSPRVGIAYAPNSAWVIRSGFGIFYDRFLLASINRLLELDGAHGQMQIAEGAEAATLYQSGAQLAKPLPGIAPSLWQAQPHWGNPYSEVALLGVERALPQGWTAKAEFQHVHGVKLGRTANVNLAPPVTLTTQNAASLGVTNPAPQQIGRPVFTAQRLNPQADAIDQLAMEADSSYNGATFTLNRQFDEQFELMAGYTWSKTIDDASYDTEQPQNPYDLRAERALSLLDQRQRFTLSGLWVLGPDLDDPQDQAKGPSTNRILRALTGVEIAPIFAAASGFRANAVTGQDSNLEHIYPFAARPAGMGRNALATAPNVEFDLRILKMVPIGRGHLDVVAESFNLLNHTNVSLLNPAYGLAAQAQTGFNTPILAATARRVQFSLDYEY